MSIWVNKVIFHQHDHHTSICPSRVIYLYKYKLIFFWLLNFEFFRICLEYGSHLWRGASKYSLATQDAIQKRAIKLIEEPALTNSLDSLAHRRTISALSLYYRYYDGVCSVELKSIIPLKPSLLETRGFRTLSRPLGDAPSRCISFSHRFH